MNESNRTAALTHGNVSRQEDGFFNQTELTHKLMLGGMAHQVLYGIEVARQDKAQFVTRQAAGTVSLFDPVLPVVPRNANTVITNNVGTLDTNSAYLQDMITLSPQWKALAGVRFDRFEQKTAERRVNVPNVSRTDTEWSPRAGIVYQPTLNQSYYVSVSRSFQPSAELQPLTAAFADFAPEKTTNKEVGAKLDFLGGRASATASLFELERTNIKETDPVSRATVQIGEQRTRGVELMFSGDLPQGWQIWSGYAYLLTEITTSPNAALLGNRATLTPKHSANLWLTKRLGSGWRAGAGLNYVDDRAADPANNVTLPG